MKANDFDKVIGGKDLSITRLRLSHLVPIAAQGPVQRLDEVPGETKRQFKGSSITLTRSALMMRYISYCTSLKSRKFLLGQTEWEPPNISKLQTRKHLVISVPPSSAGGLQLTRTLSWNTSVTLHVNGGVGLSARDSCYWRKAQSSQVDSQLPSLISLFIFVWSISEENPKNNLIRGEQACLFPPPAVFHNKCQSDK